MVTIRLRRMGKTKKPSYRLVVADSRAPRDGKFIEIVGHYNPVRQPKELSVKSDRVRYWLSVGAQPSETVVRLLKQVGVLDADGKPVPATPAPVEGESYESVA
ncbi:MAG: 30S ribosomal protein S16 [Roseiflexus sp.]